MNSVSLRRPGQLAISQINLPRTLTTDTRRHAEHALHLKQRMLSLALHGDVF